jgi:hypothetical protein
MAYNLASHLWHNAEFRTEAVSGSDEMTGCVNIIIFKDGGGCRCTHHRSYTTRAIILAIAVRTAATAIKNPVTALSIFISFALWIAQTGLGLYPSLCILSRPGWRYLPGFCRKRVEFEAKCK